MILTPISNQLILTINQRSTVKEVCHIIQTVEIQAISTQGLPAVVQNHVLACSHHLHLPVILCSITSERQGISLPVMNMSESFY